MSGEKAITKKTLVNRVNKEEMKQRMLAETFKRRTISFYRYVIIEDPVAFRNKLFLDFDALNCFGRIYIAHEGVNAQMNVPAHHHDELMALLNGYKELENIPIKYAVEDDGKSFYKLTIKVREKIVADGLPDDAFDVTNAGKHLTAKEFNAALEDPNAIVVDLRNNYESEVGHFENAICPDVTTFKEEMEIVTEMLADKKDKKLLLYCTGGVRCEKASAYFKHLGYEDVNQLYGGIIDYSRQIKAENLPSKFIGKNFVFDERLGERITDDIIGRCHQCGAACDSHTNCGNTLCHNLFIQCPECASQYEGCCSTRCQDILHLPEEERKKLTPMNPPGKKYYSKKTYFKEG